MLIDSHSHIDGAEFQLDIDEVFARMKEAEVGGALVAGTSLQDYERGLNFANAHKNVWYAAGVHPSTKDDDHEASIEDLVGLTKPQKVVAIGECGLDYYYEEAPYDAQLERFARHIEAAKLANLPVIVHSRDAQEDTIRLLKEHDAGSTGFVLHCFTGDKKMAQDALDLGGDTLVHLLGRRFVNIAERVLEGVLADPHRGGKIVSVEIDFRLGNRVVIIDLLRSLSFGGF